jgi:hypothetical protein
MKYYTPYINFGGLEYQRLFYKYHEDLGFPASELYSNIKFGGSDLPVQVKVIYIFPMASEYQSTFADQVTTDPGDSSNTFRTNATQINNVITLTYQYANLEEFSENKWAEYKYLAGLVANEVTREVKIEYL